MTVAELIAQLQKVDRPTAQVVVEAHDLDEAGEFGPVGPKPLGPVVTTAVARTIAEGSRTEVVIVVRDIGLVRS